MAKNVALYVDYENIRITLEKNFRLHADPSKIGTVVRKIAQEQGKVIVQNVYGDWSFLHPSPKGSGRIDAKKALTATGLKPVDVPVKGSGPDTKDRTDIWLVTEASFDLFKKRNIGIVMIVSSDGDYCPLVRNIQGENKDVVVCGFTVSMSQELMRIADKTIFLEHPLGLEAPVNSDSTADLKLNYDWIKFIEALDKAENMPWSFVGLKRFRDNWINASMGVVEPSQKHEMINEAIREQIIVTHTVVNPNEPRFQTTAIKLNKVHPLVAGFLKSR